MAYLKKNYKTSEILLIVLTSSYDLALSFNSASVHGGRGYA